jgi:hypothetical protein
MTRQEGTELSPTGRVIQSLGFLRRIVTLIHEHTITFCYRKITENYDRIA